jgi:UDP-glucose 4-epimerase
MNFLITGAAGFLGSTLANRLAWEGHQVRGLDDLSTGDPSALHADVLFTRGDVNDRPKLWTLLQDVDCVYHLAARVSVPESIIYPREYNAVNVGGTVSLMEAMRDVGVRRVVLISSGAVYGDQGEQPLKENAIPFPFSLCCFQAGCRVLRATIGDLWGLETVSLRVFNAYGPGQHLPPSHPPVIPNFLRQAVRGGTLVVHGSGSQTRDYVYIDDVINAMVAAATAPGWIIWSSTWAAARNSVRELTRKVLETTHSDAEVLFNPRNDPGVSRMCADLSLAQAKLGYQPRISLPEGLNLTLKRDQRFIKEPPTRPVPS